MSTESILQSSYNGLAEQYDAIETLPQIILSQQLVAIALGDCTGEVILDLGGGSGFHARSAVAAGAQRVDNLDISTDMLRRCDDAERRAGRNPGERVLSIEGDAMKPLSGLGLEGRDRSALYDKTLVIWTMDHAYGSELEAMWENVSKHTRPGGKVISIRLTDPFKLDPKVFKYGVTYTRLEPTAEGVSLDYTPHDRDGRPMFTASSASMKAHYDLAMARSMASKFGFGNLEVVSPLQAPCVQADWEYWRDFIDGPNFVCVYATKES